MRKVRTRKKQQLKNVGTATALTVVLVTYNVSTLTYAFELEKEVNTISSNVNNEEIKQEVVVPEQEVDMQEKELDAQEVRFINEKEKLATEEKSKITSLDELKNNWDYRFFW